MRPITAEDLAAAEEAVAAFMVAMGILGRNANTAKIRNVLRLYALQTLSGGDGTLVISSHEHVEPMFLSARTAQVTAPTTQA